MQVSITAFIIELGRRVRERMGGRKGRWERGRDGEGKEGGRDKETTGLTPPTGLHLEIDPRGGEMSIYEKEGGRSPVYMCICTCTLRGSGGMFPQEILVFRLRLLLVHSQGLCSE